MSKLSDFNQNIRRHISMMGSDSPVNTWLQEEKDVIKELRNLAKEQGHANKFLAEWGKVESEDLRNITEKLAIISEKMVEATNQYANQYEKSRLYIKEIKANEDSLLALHRKQKDLRTKLDNAQKKKNKDVEAIRKELGELDQEVLAREAFHEGFKRERLKAAMNARWDGLMEYSAKLSVISNFGNHLANQIPQGYPTPGAEVPPFLGGQTTSQILMDYEKCATNWTASVPWPFDPAILPPLGQTPAIPSADTAAATRLSWNTKSTEASTSSLATPGGLAPSSSGLNPTPLFDTNQSSPIPSPQTSPDVAAPYEATPYNAGTASFQSVPYIPPSEPQPYVASAAVENRAGSISQPYQAPMSLAGPGNAPNAPVPVPQEVQSSRVPEPYAAAVVSLEENRYESTPQSYAPGLPYHDNRPVSQPYAASTAPPSQGNRGSGGMAQPYAAPTVSQPYASSAGPVHDSRNTGVIPQPYDAVPFAAQPAYPARNQAPISGYSTPSVPFEARPVNTYAGYAAPLDPSLAPSNVVVAALQPVPHAGPATPSLDVGNSSSKPTGGPISGGGPISPHDSMSAAAKLKSDARGATLTRPPPPPPSYEAAAHAVRKAVGGLGVFVVCFDWVPNQNDELALMVGDAVAASEVYEDGWAYGRVLRTGAIGFFPFNAVVPAIDGFGEAARSPAGQPTPESLRDEGSVSLDAYRVIIEAIASLRGPGRFATSPPVGPPPPSLSQPQQSNPSTSSSASQGYSSSHMASASNEAPANASGHPGSYSQP
ncbi:hypothetical protein HDU67_008475 [Dinochytrium kinnereticum]|nr:hypothetical protein HDU67_008475 [Dinochytrium kinnereticum]